MLSNASFLKHLRSKVGKRSINSMSNAVHLLEKSSALKTLKEKARKGKKSECKAGCCP